MFLKSFMKSASQRRKGGCMSKCSCCRTAEATEKVVNRKMCSDCLKKCCPLCKAILSEEEKALVPIFGEIDQDYQKQLLSFRKPWRPCFSCYINKMRKAMAEELRRTEQKWLFQIENQWCRCGSVNDSRNEHEVLESRFCRECRKEYGDDVALRRRDEKRPSAPNDNRTFRFDRVVGFVQK